MNECHIIDLTLARARCKRCVSVHGVWWMRPPLAVWPLIELELRGKDERVARDETKPIVSDFSVLGQLVTSEVRSMPKIGI